MKTKQKGTRAEYKLKKILEAQGYLIVRAAGSGHDTPDIFAFRNGEVLIFEVKNSKKDIYFREEQYDALKKFIKIYINLEKDGQNISVRSTVFGILNVSLTLQPGRYTLLNQNGNVVVR